MLEAGRAHGDQRALEVLALEAVVEDADEDAVDVAGSDAGMGERRAATSAISSMVSAASDLPNLVCAQPTICGSAIAASHADGPLGPKSFAIRASTARTSVAKSPASSRWRSGCMRLSIAAIDSAPATRPSG